MIEDVKELGSDLQIHLLRNGCVLEDRKIKLLERGPSQRVTAQVPKWRVPGTQFVSSVVPSFGVLPHVHGAAKELKSRKFVGRPP